MYYVFFCAFTDSLKQVMDLSRPPAQVKPVAPPILPCSLVLSVDHWTGVSCLLLFSGLLVSGAMTGD